MDYILLFLFFAVLGMLAFASMYPEKLPYSLQGYARDFNKWRGSISYDQILWIASIMMALSKSKTLSGLGGPFELFRSLLERISRLFYNLAGDWMAATMTEEEKTL